MSSMSSKKSSYATMIKSTSPLPISATKMEELLDKEIGRGGFGIIYTHKTDPKLCIKVSEKSENKPTKSCREWSNEYKKIMEIKKKIYNNIKNLKMTRIVFPTRFIETQTKCYMELPLIYRPDRDLDKPTIQALLGVESQRTVYNGRGEFIGLQEIRELISEPDLETACYELGIIMGLIHYIAKNDAYDIEVIIGKEYHTKKTRFYLIDFDLTNKIDEYDNKTIENMTWALDAVPYFPYKSVDPTLYELFRNGYYSIVPRELADSIFENYG